MPGLFALFKILQKNAAIMAAALDMVTRDAAETSRIIDHIRFRNEMSRKYQTRIKAAAANATRRRTRDANISQIYFRARSQQKA